MSMTEFWIGLVSSAAGTLGFSLIFRLRPRYLLPASVGGILAFVVYAIGVWMQWNLFGINLAAATVAALFSECCARGMKAPTVLFSIPCIIPLVPGSLLYYTMSNLAAGKYDESFSYFVETLLTSLGIAGGLIVVSLFFVILTQISQKRKQVKQ